MSEALKALLASGVDITNPSATAAVIDKPEVLDQAIAENVRIEPEPYIEAEEPEAPEEQPQALAEPGEAPEPTGTVTEEDPRIASLTEQIRQLTEQKTALESRPVVIEPSESKKERDAELQAMIEEYGDDHLLVKRTRRENAEADKREQAEVQTTSAVAERERAASEQAAHAKHIVTVPYLKSFFDNNDEESIEVAAAISNVIMRDPKLAGTAAATPFTAEHYREVEARLLRRNPEAKAKFYRTKPATPSTGTSGKVVQIRDLKGGQSPVPGSKPAMDRADFMRFAMEHPELSVDQALAQYNVRSA